MTQQIVTTIAPYGLNGQKDVYLTPQGKRGKSSFPVPSTEGGEWSNELVHGNSRGGSVF